MRGVAGPYPDRLVLRRGRYVGFLEDCGRPGHVADPVGVAGELFDGGVGLVLCTADALSATVYSSKNRFNGISMRAERTCTPIF